MNDGLLNQAGQYELREDARAGLHWARRAGVRIDLHCHSSFSVERLKYVPGLIYHPMLEPEQVYDLARRRGMDFVTLTDHDTIDGCKALLERRGDLPDFIVAEEVSAVFPEDGLVVHVNVYDIDERQHEEIQRLRRNIYDLVQYLRRIDKLYVLNHLTWNEQHRALARWQLDALLELFHVFEGINGTRSYAHNAFAWCATQGCGKVLVGGSDSHTNRVGTTHTLTEGGTRAEVLASIRAGRAAPCGSFGTPEKLREDVWLTLQGELERRVRQTSSAWMRATCYSVAWVGKLISPIVCLGYHARQNLLIRDFTRTMPA